MGYRDNVAAGRLMLLLLTALACARASLATSSALEQALAAVEDCIAASSPAWPDAWCIEYVDVIRDALTVCEEPSDYALRLDALREGFPLCWAGVKTSADRALFVGVCLVGGVFVGGALLGSIGLGMMFTYVLASALYRRLDISCGCFSGAAGKISYITLIRAIVITALSAAAYAGTIFLAPCESFAPAPEPETEREPQLAPNPSPSVS